MTLTPLETEELAARRASEKVGGLFRLTLLTFAEELWKLQQEQEKPAHDLQVSRDTDETKA